MIVYLVRVKHSLNGDMFIDSMWPLLSDAESRLKALKEAFAFGDVGSRFSATVTGLTLTGATMGKKEPSK